MNETFTLSVTSLGLQGLNGREKWKRKNTYEKDNTTPYLIFFHLVEETNPSPLEAVVASLPRPRRAHPAAAKCRLGCPARRAYPLAPSRAGQPPRRRRARPLAQSRARGRRPGAGVPTPACARPPRGASPRAGPPPRRRRAPPLL